MEEKRLELIDYDGPSETCTAVTNQSDIVFLSKVWLS